MVTTFIFSFVFKCGFCLERNDGMVLLLVTILLLILVAIPVFRKWGFSVFSPSGNLEDRINLHLMLEQFGRLSFPYLELPCWQAIRLAVVAASPSLSLKRLKHLPNAQPSLA